MTALASAFRNSWRGLSLAARSERAVRQELVLLVLAVPLAALIAGGLWVRVALIASMVLVVATELLNTALEKLCDHVTPEHHPAIGAVKDLGSAAAFGSQAIALLVWGAAAAEALAR